MARVTAQAHPYASPLPDTAGINCSSYDDTNYSSQSRVCIELNIQYAMDSGTEFHVLGHQLGCNMLLSCQEDIVSSSAILVLETVVVSAASQLVSLLLAHYPQAITQYSSDVVLVSN